MSEEDRYDDSDYICPLCHRPEWQCYCEPVEETP